MELDTDQYDLIVLGTGFVESVVAGAAARNGLKVLHLDNNDYYSGYHSSNPLSSFESLLQSTPEDFQVQQDKWPSQSFTCIPASTQPAPKFTNVKIYTNPNPEPKKETTQSETKSETPAAAQETKDSETPTGDEKKETTESEKTETPVGTETTDDTKKDEPVNPRSRFESYDILMKSGRQFSIDILPRLLFSRGEMVNLLISSSVGRYLEFKCLEKTFLLSKDNNIQPVPCSKGDIFQSKYITNMERRMLTRLMQLIQSDLEEPGKIDPTKYGSFYDFVKSQNLSPNLEMFILYAISLCSADQQTSPDKVSAADGLRTLKTYVSSVSRYGNTPFLCPLYGTSEIPQAFCRLCAVYGGMYVLRRTAQCLLIDPNTNQFNGIVCSVGQTLKAPHFVSTGSYFPNLLGANPTSTRLSRCVVITDQPIIEVDKEKGHATFLIVPPSSLQNSHAIHIFQLDQSLSVASKGKYVLHFVTETTTSAEQDLGKAVAHFVNLPQITDEEIVPSKPFAQWVGYFNVSVHTPNSVTSPTYPKGVYLVSEGSKDKTEIDYKDLLEEAKEVFKLVCPDQEFLPRVPNPEDIIWGGEPVEENTTQTSTENEEGATESEEKNEEEKEEKKEEKQENQGEEKPEEKKEETNQ